MVLTTVGVKRFFVVSGIQKRAGVQLIGQYGITVSRGFHPAMPVYPSRLFRGGSKLAHFLPSRSARLCSGQSGITAQRALFSRGGVEATRMSEWTDTVYDLSSMGANRRWRDGRLRI